MFEFVFSHKKPSWLLPIIALFFSPTAVFGQNSIAILGDRLASGTFAHPAVGFNAETIQRFNARELKQKPDKQAFSRIVLPASPREFHGGVAWALESGITRVLDQYFNELDMTYSMLLAKKLGYQPRDVLWAVDSSHQIGQMPRQIDRVLDSLQGRSLDRMIISFAINDFCAQLPQLVVTGDAYYRQLIRGLQYFIRNVEAGAKTEIILIPPFQPTQWLVNPAVLKSEVSVYGKKWTCSEIREQKYLKGDGLASMAEEALYALQLVTQNQKRMCPTLFGQEELAQNQVGFFEQFQAGKREKAIKGGVEDLMGLVAQKARDYWRMQTKAAKEVLVWSKKTFPDKQISIKSLDGLHKFQLQDGYLAADCMHLSSKGHEAVFGLLDNEYGTISAN